VKKNILIMGSGNIAYRHLQSIIDNKNIHKIYVYDINKSIYSKLHDLLNYSKNIRKLIFVYDLKKINIKNFYLALITSYAYKRFNVINLINKKFKIKFFLIEKVVENNIKNLIKLKKLKLISYVNLHMRMMKAYKMIKNKLEKKYPIECLVVGKKWNLASNSLHYINYVSHASNSKVKRISFKKISKPYETKRQNIIDFFGEIDVTYKNGSSLKLKSTTKKIKRKMQIKQNNNNYEYYIDDNILSLNNEKFLIKLENTSILSGVFLNSLINNKISLPTFDEHFLENKLFLESLLKALNKKELIYRIT
jgi:hypothetical protein